MVIAVSNETARTQSAALVQAGVIPAYRIEYIGAKPDRGGAGRPQAFTVEMSPNKKVGAHYHTVSQYQVILRGGGHIGSHPVSTYSVHYTDPYTTYGPLVAGPDALHYMTLRAAGDPGPQYLAKPGVKEAIRPSRRRFLLSTDIRSSTPDEAAALTSPHIDVLLEPNDDGVASTLYRLGPNMTVRGPDPSLGGGHYFMVIGGALEFDGERLDIDSTLFVEADDPALTLRAGGAGADVLFLQFPKS